MSSNKRLLAPSGGGRKRDSEERRRRRRLLQARQRATMASLFDNLRAVVCPSPTSSKTPAKWKILDHAKGFLREQEAYLSRLLHLKGIFLSNENGPCSLEEVRNEYRKLSSHSRRQGCGCQCPAGEEEEEERTEESSEAEEEVTDESVPSQSSASSLSNILEFEGYLAFYQQSVETLVRCGALGPAQTSLPVVSEAISGLWDSMPPERRAAYQSFTPHPPAGPRAWAGPSSSSRPLPPGPEPHPRGLQGATASSSSTYEEDLLQDAYDVVKRELDPTGAADSVAAALPQCGGYDSLGDDIMGFVKTEMSETPEHTQELCWTVDEIIFLSCSESLDSEDML